ncbi:MAG: SsrA-binding protein SmpB [Acetobacteraceae bacterium]|nr:SsrA-binding protein SmpB [Acetobacteraceae bacterium]
MAGKGKPAGEAGLKVVGVNRRARHDYHIEEACEAGLVLTGTEVKSLRLGRVSLQDAYAEVNGGEVYLVNCHIAPYAQAHRFNHPPRRRRKLLLNRGEIARLAGRVRERGYTLVPLRVYFKGSWAKVELGLGRGKKVYDRRRDIAEREARRQVERALKGRGRGEEAAGGDRSGCRGRARGRGARWCG